MRSQSIYSRFSAWTVTGSLLALAGLTSGCEGQSPSGPSSQPSSTALTVTAITPSKGSTVSPAPVTIRGTGFLTGATVTLDGVATDIAVVNGTTITAVAPPHGAGTVDVVVTNLGGQSARLAGAFTYGVEQPYTLTSSRNTVVARGELTVTWTAPKGSARDWLGFFKVTDPSTNYESGWWHYTDGATSGTLALSAPTAPGQYEFRYLLDDGYVETVRSAPVTVTSE